MLLSPESLVKTKTMGHNQTTTLDMRNSYHKGYKKTNKPAPHTNKKNRYNPMSKIPKTKMNHIMTINF